jgi:hypothetical protein
MMMMMNKEIHFVYFVYFAHSLVHYSVHLYKTSGFDKQGGTPTRKMLMDCYPRAVQFELTPSMLPCIIC